MWNRHLALAVAVLAALTLLACDRNIEPFSDDPVEQPDLSRIFPEGASARGDRPPIMPGAGGERGNPSPPQARSTSGEAVRGTLRLAPELEGRVPNGAILFVIARVGVAGPPTAVLRIPDPVFPLDFAIGPEHRMIEQMPFAGPFTLTARVDADGNAMSRNPGDLQGGAPQPHSPGEVGVEIVIDEVL